MAVTGQNSCPPAGRHLAVCGQSLVAAVSVQCRRPALDPIGGLLGVREFPATAAGYAGLLGWLGGFGDRSGPGRHRRDGQLRRGPGPPRHHGWHPGRRSGPLRRVRTAARQGKSDPLDAVSAARAAQSGRAAGAPKGRDGAVEAIRALMVAKRSARSERVQTINQRQGPGPDRARLTGDTRFARHTAARSLTGKCGQVTRGRRRSGSA